MEKYKDFNKYVYWLGKDIPIEMQNEAKRYLLNCDEKYIPYIICTSNPFTWENAIDVIYQIGYPKNKTATYAAMYLLQDVNWSFTEKAIKVVSTVYTNDPKYVVSMFEKVTLKAFAANDTSWLWGLCYLKELLQINNDEFSSTSILEMLLHGDYK